MSKFNLMVFVAVAVLLCGCVPSKYVQYVETCKYDAKTGVTNFQKFPLGYVNIPGKWEKSIYISYSKQQYFKNSDSVSIAIAFWPKTEYSIYQKGDNDISFLKKYYERNTRFLGEQAKGKWQILKIDSVGQNHIICKFYNDSNINSCYLYGMHDNSFYNIEVDGTKWNEQQKISFLEKAFIRTN